MIEALDHSGLNLLHDPNLNKGTAFTEQERKILGLEGLLPPHVATMEEQVERVMAGLHSKSNDLEKHIFLIGLHFTFTE